MLFWFKIDMNNSTSNADEYFRPQNLWGQIHHRQNLDKNIQAERPPPPPPPNYHFQTKSKHYEYLYYKRIDMLSKLSLENTVRFKIYS
jgi:hypothetical protein